ncbi:DUF3073 domain-containing protein [Streptomyces sp. 8N706]|uniref:DUF3073 domain-containing protein n=1 Tax=Streptomyces sp. 8N706 TaxID=3457416 RepID=UPI003FD3E0D2
MGRGRAKAKQAKVARELKYTSPSADFDALQRELAGRPTVPEEKEELDHDQGIPERRPYGHPYDENR